MSINRELNRLISVHHQSSRRLTVPLNHPTKGAASFTYQTFEVFVRVFGTSSFTKNSSILIKLFLLIISLCSLGHLAEVPPSASPPETTLPCSPGSGFCPK